MPKIRKQLTGQESAVAEDIRQQFGGSLTLQDISGYLGVARNTAKKWTADISCININGRRRWLVSDVARKIESCREA